MHYPDDLRRTDHMIDGEAGRLFLREVHATGAPPDARLVLLVHGARVPGIPSFDLPVQGGSLAADLASARLRVFVGDLRGYGNSDRLPEMEQDPATSRPLVRVREAARDIDAMVHWIAGRAGYGRVSLVGWATGGMWCGYYAAAHPEHVERLVLYNSLYRSPGHPMLGAGSDLEDSSHPGRFNASAIGGYRFNAPASLLGAWDASIPVENADDWRDPRVAACYVDEAIKSDPISAQRKPPGFSAPTGALEDSFYQATGRQLYDASLIECPTMVIAGEGDFWSQAVDREELVRHLNHAPDVRVHVVPGGTHFVHLDRPSAGRDEFMRQLVDFLS